MNNYIFYIFLYFLSFSSQNDNIQNNIPYLGENLLLNSSNYEYIIFKEKNEKIEVNLIGKITKEGNKIKSKNYLVINNKEEINVQFEDIGSVHILNDKIIICPRGKYHPVEYYNGDLKEIIPLKFIENGNWDLKCKFDENDKLKLFYLMNGKNSIYTYINYEFILDKNIFFEELYDFKKVDENNDISESILFACLDNGIIKIFQLYSELNNFKSVVNSKSFSQANFDNDENKFYFITYNNASDFISGYANLDKIDDLSLVNIIINDISPFKLESNFEIQEINFMNNKRYIYYKIYDRNIENFSFGVFDIILNKIIFNLDENNIIVKQNLRDSITIINSNSAYKLSFKDAKFEFNNNYTLYDLADSCYELCDTCSRASVNPNNQRCLTCKSGFILVGVNCTCPKGKQLVGIECKTCQNVCYTYQLNSCKCSSCVSGYYINSSGYCQKCPYDVTNCTTENCCKCKNNYFWELGKCYRCNTSCKTLESDNCRCFNCFDEYYLSNHQCLKCSENCKTCTELSYLCTSCKDGLFLENNQCSSCNSSCRTCEETSNKCTGCNSDKFLYENQCYECATHCTTYKEGECSCLTCENKFENVNYQCKECENATTCSQYENNKCICERCVAGYYLLDGKCLNCDSNCETCQSLPTKCTSCKNNYFLSDNECYECTDCKEKEENSCKCLSCTEGKYLENNQCKNCSFPCKSCETEPNRCQTCEDGYYYDHYQCISCHNRCKTCNSGSIGENNHNCQSCKDEFVFHENNCLNECPEKYYENNKECFLCNQLCNSTGAHCNNCTSCIEGYYLLENEMNCKKCNENCKTCNNMPIGDNQNCLTCDINSTYKYLVNATGFGSNCVSSCPSGTVLGDNFICILEVPKENKKNKESGTALTIALSILGGMVLIGLAIFIFTFVRRKRKNSLDPLMNQKLDDKIIKEINEDLNLYKSFT